MRFLSGLTRGDGLLVPLDLAQASVNERFECLTCHRTGPLTTRGVCGNCGSSQVIPEAKVQP